MNAATLEHLLKYIDIKQFFTDNSPLRLLIILVIMLLMGVGAYFLCEFARKKLEALAQRDQPEKGGGGKPALDAMDFTLFESVMKNTRHLLWLGVLYWGLSRLIITEAYAEAIKLIFTALCVWAGIKFFTAFVPFNIDLYLRRRGATLGTSQSRSLMPIVKGVIWAVGLTFLLDNLGFHVSTIIAGLGIVGVAVGLAGQAILADFFSYIVILLDKPFRIGDYVELGDGRAGDVEYMGPKTTHLRNLEDDLIVCANSEMTKGTLINQGSVHQRVVIMDIGVDYATPIDVLKKLPDILRDVINAFPHCSFDRACLLKFGNSSLNYQLIYYVGEQRGGIRDFMITRSKVNVAILERFGEEGINIPFPTESVFVSNVDNRAPAKPEKPTTQPEKQG